MELDVIRKEDVEVANLIEAELKRQQNTIELIASENFTSPAVMAACGSVLTNKYAEGKLIMPGGGVLYGTYGTGMARYYWKGEGYIRSGTPCYAMKGHLFRDRTTIVELLANRYALPVRCVRQ